LCEKSLVIASLIVIYIYMLVEIYIGHIK